MVSEMYIYTTQFIKGFHVIIKENEFLNPFILECFDVVKIKELISIFNIRKIVLCGAKDFTEKYKKILQENDIDVIVEQM